MKTETAKLIIIAAISAFWLCILYVSLSFVQASELPDANLTPGVTRDVTKETLCTSSTKLFRHTSAQTKAQAYLKYGLAPKHAAECTGVGHSCYEVDHLIPLEIGGADVEDNLWPQEYEVVPADPSWQKNGAHKKDSLENRLHKEICAGAITMQEAQTCISTNWVECYDKVMK